MIQKPSKSCPFVVWKILCLIFAWKSDSKSEIFQMTRRGNPLTCQFCFKRFRKYNGLKAHLVVHTGERNFICKTCGMSFTQKGNLKRHSLARHGQLLQDEICWFQKKFHCHYCLKTFKYPSLLKRHLAYHEGNKQFRCQLCGEEFFHKFHLNSHMKTH